MDSIKTIIQSLLNSVGDLTQPQQKFLVTLFSTLLISYGRANFTNLGRYSQLSERTYRRQDQRSFNFMKFNQQLIKRAIEPESPVILAVDCSFIPKSGKQTYGIDYFYNGSVSRAEKGLEVSAMAVVDVNHKTAYNLSVQQTPASSSSLEKIESAQNTRIDCYLEQLKATFPYLPSSLRYVVSDGFYSNSSSGCSYAVLFCTDLKLNPYSIYLYYKARFQIEFIFRDSKQFTGLADCQARDLTKLDFHFNSSLTALNLAKLDAVEQHDSDSKLLKPL